MRKMRRFKQELAADEAKRILYNGRECVMAVDGDSGYPYAVPVNYVYDGEHIYIHSAAAGQKIDALRRNNCMSLCVIERGDIVPEEFTTYFKSVIVFGHVRFVDNLEEKSAALYKLCEKYCSGLDPSAEIQRFLKTVAILEITIDHISGKQSIELIG